MGELWAGCSLIWGGLVAAQPHGNQPKEKTSPARYSSFVSFAFHFLKKRKKWRKQMEGAGVFLFFGLVRRAGQPKATSPKRR